jgi:hypothetical protein
VTQDFLTARRSLIADAVLRRLVERTIPDDDIVDDIEAHDVTNYEEASCNGLTVTNL